VFPKKSIVALRVPQALPMVQGILKTILYFQSIMIYITTQNTSDYIPKSLEILVVPLTPEILRSPVMKAIMNASKEGLTNSQIALKLNIPTKAVSNIFLENQPNSGDQILSELLSWNIPEEETIIRSTNPQTEHPIDKLWAELEEIYLAELNKSIYK
jgi:hypothetical protein